jgi:hypothetical protein
LLLTGLVKIEINFERAFLRLLKVGGPKFLMRLSCRGIRTKETGTYVKCPDEINATLSILSELFNPIIYFIS